MPLSVHYFLLYFTDYYFMLRLSASIIFVLKGNEAFLLDQILAKLKTMSILLGIKGVL